MGAKLVHAFVLHIDGEAKAVGASLEEAQRLAAPYLGADPIPDLRIETFAAPAPSRIWYYDPADAVWVERV